MGYKTIIKHKMNWKDVSSHSQKAKDRTPHSWQCEVEGIRISVHKHTHYHEDQWLLSCNPFYHKYELVHKDIDKAKGEALLTVWGALNKISNALFPYVENMHPTENHRNFPVGE